VAFYINKYIKDDFSKLKSLRHESVAIRARKSPCNSFVGVTKESGEIKLFIETFVSHVRGKPYLKWKDVKLSFAYLKLLFGYTRYMKTLMRKLCDDLNIFLKKKKYRAILIAVHRTIGLVLLNAPASVRGSARPIRACPWFIH